MAKLLDQRHGYRYAQVRRWTKRMNIFSHRRLFFPINISNAHWVLVVVQPGDRTITYYDSLQGLYDGSVYLRTILQYLQDEAADKKQPTIHPRDWTLIDSSNTATPPPQQPSGSVECGVFAIIYADLISRDRSIHMDPDDYIELRRYIAHSILRGCLSPISIPHPSPLPPTVTDLTFSDSLPLDPPVCILQSPEPNTPLPTSPEQTPPLLLSSLHENQQATPIDLTTPEANPTSLAPDTSWLISPVPNPPLPPDEEYLQ